MYESTLDTPKKWNSENRTTFFIHVPSLYIFNNKVNKRQYCMNLAVFRPFAMNLFIIRASLGANLWLIQFIRQDIERLSSVLIWNAVMGLMAVNVYE